MKIFVVGLGPGSLEDMTIRAYRALKQSDVITGYTVYIDLIRERFEEKEFVSTPMRKEEQRCILAIEEAKKGKTVSLVCSGDAGVYGMAGLLYQIAQDYKDIEVEVVPGVTAACSGAAVLGAPLGHDFAIISLSDLLTPWPQIEKRLAAAASADFAICLYNPSSKNRADYLQKACDIILDFQPPELICGAARNIGREGESYQIMSLSQLRNTKVDMYTTVFIGNSNTLRLKDRMITPRGYKNV